MLSWNKGSLALRRGKQEMTVPCVSSLMDANKRTDPQEQSWEEFALLVHSSYMLCILCMTACVCMGVLLHCVWFPFSSLQVFLQQIS